MQGSFGNVWEDVLAFALKVDGVAVEGAQLRTGWHDAYSVSDKERFETANLKR